MVELIIQRDFFASGGIFLHIGSQCENLELFIPGAVRPFNSAKGSLCTVRHHHIKPFIRLVSPGIAQTEKLAVDLFVRTDASIATTATDGSGESERIGSRGIDPHLIATLTHLNGINTWVSPQVSF